MSRVNNLALENRPKAWADILGQEIARTVLSNTVLSGAIEPAYLLMGLTGSGKTSLAQLFARSMLCPNRGGALDPCNREDCPSCTRMNKMKHPDFYYVDGAANRSIEFVRTELYGYLSRSPQLGAYKFLVIDEIHGYEKLSQHALLTKLENMPPQSVVCLCTTDAGKIDRALANRCCPFNLGPVPLEPMARRVADYIEQDYDAVLFLAEASGGSFRQLWSYIGVWKETNLPLTVDLAARICTGLTPAERKEFWGVLQRGDLESLKAVWSIWRERGTAPLTIRDLLLRDLIDAAAARPEEAAWYKALALLSSVREPSETLLLANLMLLRGLPLA